MREVVVQTVKRYYEIGDKSSYVKNCESIWEMPTKILDFCKIRGVEVQQLLQNKNQVWPSAKWLFTVPHSQWTNEIEVIFSSNFMVSKLAPVYYIQHEFSLPNLERESLSPVLDGYGTQAYTFIQQDLEDMISAQLGNMGYEKISYAELHEVVCALEFPKGVSVFGPQVSVEYALFHDLLDHC
ncbi:hypothetical protein ACFQMJ_22235 [Cohnella cellulosilytica]|uniref:Uncharacterized protein n=2 Tax=Cohnella cellulosilytica TaxID=986710 RepID=A0ABW2FH46_9BACL